MNAEGREIMTALQMITTVAQRYLARQEGTSQGVNDTLNDGNKGFQDNKRKCWDDKIRPRGGEKKQFLTTTVATAPTPAKLYVGNLPRCAECNYHHVGACKEYTKCKKKGHAARVVKTPSKTFCPSVGHIYVECENKKEERPCQIPPGRQGSMTVLVPTTTMTPTLQKQYLGNLPKCNKCNFHHNGVCREMRCTSCKKKGHTVRFCKTPPQATTQAANTSVSRTCYECGEAGHFKRDCPKLKNRNVGGMGKVLGYGD